MKIEVSQETFQEILNCKYDYRFFYSKSLNTPIYFHTKIEFYHGNYSIFCDVIDVQDKYVDVAILVIIL
jgi:hypothetical protein